MFVRSALRSRLWALAVAATVLTVPAARADKIDKELMEKSGVVIKYLKDHKVKTVGVLKFRAQKGDGGESLNVGPINSKMAERLEMTLIMTLPIREIKPPVNVLHDASGFIAAQKLGLDYITPADRAKLFAMKYPEAVGVGQLSPDVFLTGTVKLDTKSRKTTVTIKAFGKDTNGFDDVAKFEVDTDRSTLSDVGMGFALAKRGGVLPDENAVDSASNFVAPSSSAGGKTENPVELKVFINDLEVSTGFDMKDSKSKLRLEQKPNPGDRIYVTLQNKLNDRRYAAVLKVNGTSTLFDETAQAQNCRKFILKPNAEPLKIGGFYDNENGKDNLTPFAVSLNNPSANEPLQDAELGLISLYVFEEGDNQSTIPEASSNLETRGLSKKKWETQKPKTYAELATALKGRKPDTRTFIVKDSTKTDGGQLVPEPFVNPSQVYFLQIRYLGSDGRVSD